MRKRFLITGFTYKSKALFIGLFIAICGVLFASNQNRPVFASSELAEVAIKADEAQAALVITVDTTEDHTQSDINSSNQNLLKYTCTFTQGALFFPAPDGKCTLRRAIVESSARPQSDRADGIFIHFNIPANEANLGVDGTWTIELDSVLPPMETDSIINLNGSVTIDGSTQPSGRVDGPPIIIDTGDTSLEIESTNNVIKHISWKNGGAIFIKNKADNNTIQNIWMGLSDNGQEIHFRDVNDRKRLAMGGMVIASNNNTVTENVISGAFAKAINIDGGDDNLISSNRIGTRADGTIPVVDEANECNPSFSYDPTSWYGGWGLALSGSRNEISNNIILNMHIMRSQNDTSPVALEIFGADHTIKNNRIGVDINGADEGVCGHAMNITGSGHEIAENIMAKTKISFEEGEESAMFSRDSSPLFGQNEIYGNIVRDGPGKILIFSGNINSSLKFFVPARITKINGTSIEGQAEEDYPCPNCKIDFYLDDTDEIEEALEWLGSVVADGDGKFTFDMGKVLPAGHGIRTMATTQNAGVIGSFGAGTTSEASQLYTPITDIVFTGPTTGFTGVPYQINFQVDPVAVTLPITYSIKITDLATPKVIVDGGRLENVVHTWSTAGTKTIEVTADNGLSTRTESHQIVIEQGTVVGAITDIVFSGPTTGQVNTAYEFSFTMEPADAATPLDILLEATDKNDLTGTLSSRNGTYTTGGWSTPGTKTIKVTASNGVNSLSKSFQIVISESSSSSDKFIYLPFIVR